MPTQRVPDASCARIVEHNRSYWIAAALDFWGAALAWAVAGAQDADSVRRAKMLMALQFAGWIDLHRGEEDWSFRVPSDQEQTNCQRAGFEKS